MGEEVWNWALLAAHGRAYGDQSLGTSIRFTLLRAVGSVASPPPSECTLGSRSLLPAC